MSRRDKSGAVSSKKRPGSEREASGFVVLAVSLKTSVRARFWAITCHAGVGQRKISMSLVDRLLRTPTGSAVLSSYGRSRPFFLFILVEIVCSKGTGPPRRARNPLSTDTNIYANLVGANELNTAACGKTI